MVFPILGANSATGEYEVSNSLRFNDNDSARLSRTPSSEGNRKTWSYSTWFKRGNLKSSGTMNFISAGAQSGTNGTGIQTNNDAIRLIHDDGTPFFTFQSSQVLRDVAAWYHLLVTCDTTDGTAGDRIKFYLNGNNITSDMSYTNGSAPSQNSDLRINDDGAHNIGARSYHNDNFFDGYMAETHLIDGTVKAPTDFGEFDDNGVWIPKKYTGTYGTNGFYLEFKQTGTSANSSGIGADTSGNDHHFTVNNLAATDVTEDTCTNNFATLNPLKTTSTNANLSEGNTKFTITANGTSQNRNTFPTISFPTSGKWYMETKVTHSSLTSDSGNQVYIGVVENPQNVDHRSTSNVNSISTNGIFTDVSIVGTLSDRIQHGTNGSATSYNTDPDWSSGNIIGIALDMDNGRIYYHLNGTYYDDASGNVPNPATPANHNHSFTVPSNGLTYFMSILRYNTGTVEMEANFGNPSYSISSGNNDGKYGNFEYAPPSGYYALCTKRLAEFG